MSTGLLLAFFYSTPWAVHQDTYLTMRSVMHRWASNAPAGEDVMARIDHDKSIMVARRQDVAQAGAGVVAVLPLYGLLAQRRQIQDVSGPGVTSLSQFSADFRAAINDSSVASILIDIDSPGGSVFGVSELADEIRASKKPVVAIANSMAASAAYWIGSAANEFYCTPSGMVGSIGVISEHMDISDRLKMDGFSPTIISAGKFKAEGNHFGPLTDECKENMQALADTYYHDFVSSVAKGRGVPIAAVREGMGQGRMVMSQDAVKEKMIDGVMTFDQLARKMVAGSSVQTQKPASKARLHSAIRSINLS